jgi:hypothetical protein
MALAVADRVKETSTTAGTGTLTLLGAVSGYQSFSAIGSGNTTYYCIVDDNTGQWEVGVGTYTSPNQLSRDSVLSSSSGGSAITFLGNIKQVFVTYPAERSVYENAAGSLVLSKVEATTGEITNLTSTSATITNLSLTSLTLSNLNIASANITTLTSTNATAASLTVSTGNLTFSSTGQRITGDMSNATIANRLGFQTSTTNGNTDLQIIPNGTSVTSGIRLNNNSDTTNAGYVRMSLNSTEASISVDRNSVSGTYLPLGFNTGGSERMRLDTSGNVGIGTASPVTTFGKNLTLYNDANTGTVASNTYLLVQSLNRNGVIDIASSATGTGSLNFVTTPGTTLAGIAGDIANSALAFRTGGATERMRIDSSGNVGIGTASPFTTIDVNGYFTAGVRNTTNISLTSGTHYFGSSPSDLVRNNIVGSINADSTTPVRLRFYKSRGTSASPTAVSSGDQTNDIQTYAYDGSSFIQATAIQASVTATPSANNVSSALSFFTNGGSSSPTERMRIDSSGNVGIGKIAASGVILDANGVSRSTQIQMPNSAGTYTANVAGFHLFGFSDNNLYFNWFDAGAIVFRNNGATERMRIDSSGNVGIGTASPGTKLDVVVSTNNGLRISDGAVTGVVYASSGPAMVVGTTSNHPTVLYSNNAERMRITTDGEIYIAGTTDQGAYNLQCNGTGVWGAGAYVNGSDARLKDNIQSLDAGLDVVKAMRPVTFQYKPDYSKDQSVQPGFIAQELQTAMAGKAYLEGVVQEGPNHLNVAYQNIIPILVKAIQELEAKVAALEAK